VVVGGEQEGKLKIAGGTSVEIKKVDDALVQVQAMAGGGGGGYDLVFVDADKGRLLEYVDVCLRSESVLKEGGVILVDNVLWKGAVMEEGGREGGEGGGDEETKRMVKLNRRKRKLARIMHEFNEAVCKDERMEVVMLPLRDGLTIIKRRK